MAETIWTPKKRDKFISKLREMPNVSRAARLTVVSRSSAYRLRETDSEFAAEWDAAIEEGVEALEEIAMRRAKKSSDTLLIFLLKAHKPEMYREQRDLNIGGKDGDNVKLELVYPD